MTSLLTTLSSLWRGLRQATGDDAYERYLEYWRADDSHDDEEPLDRKTFHARRLDQQWNQPRRCC
jgi:uncharacterized short protein YbdD (DUF466 family)